MLDRDNEACLTLDPKKDRGDVPILVVAKDGCGRIQFYPAGGTVPQSNIYFLPPTGLGTAMSVAVGGVVTFNPVVVTNLPQTGREARGIIATRYETPTMRVGASQSLVFRGPGNTYVEFDAQPSMTLIDSTGKGWKFTVLADGTGFATSTAVPPAVMLANLGNPAWFRADGRTIIGSDRPNTRPGTFRVASQLGGWVELFWTGFTSALRMMASNGTYYGVNSDGTGALVSAASPLPT